MAESKEELKSLLMKVKEESEKTALKLIIEKSKTFFYGWIISHCIKDHVFYNSIFIKCT